jgi:hypothetical protein
MIVRRVHNCELSLPLTVVNREQTHAVRDRTRPSPTTSAATSWDERALARVAPTGSWLAPRRALAAGRPPDQARGCGTRPPADPSARCDARVHGLNRAVARHGASGAARRVPARGLQSREPWAECRGRSHGQSPYLRPSRRPPRTSPATRACPVHVSGVTGAHVAESIVVGRRREVCGWRADSP